jgi:hypothetical protein
MDNLCNLRKVIKSLTLKRRRRTTVFKITCIGPYAFDMRRESVIIMKVQFTYFQDLFSQILLETKKLHRMIVRSRITLSKSL